MLRRVLSLFFGLVYACLSAGPSLWALRLAPPSAAPACSMSGCTCGHEHSPGKACVCGAMQASLLKKFPHLAKDPTFAPAPRPAPGLRGPVGQAPLNLPGTSGQAHLSTLPAGDLYLNSSPCAPSEGGGQHSLPSRPPHTLASDGVFLHLAASRARLQPAPRGRSYFPEPPTPIPD